MTTPYRLEPRPPYNSRLHPTARSRLRHPHSGLRAGSWYPRGG
jgi:hypothetical protein